MTEAPVDRGNSVPISPELRARRRHHLVEAAQGLVREYGDAGFAMTELAVRANVSAATPYNLIGSKSDLLMLLVATEHEAFESKLGAVTHATPLGVLVDATALVVEHYEGDRDFYKGLYKAALGVEGSEIHRMMKNAGRALWSGLVTDAVESGELVASVRVGAVTDVLLRAIAGATLAWLADGWDRERFDLEMALSVRLLLGSLANPSVETRLVGECIDLQDRIAAMDDAGAISPAAYAPFPGRSRPLAIAGANRRR